MLIFESFRVFVSRSNYRVCVLPHRVQFLSSAFVSTLVRLFLSAWFIFLFLSKQEEVSNLRLIPFLADSSTQSLKLASLIFSQNIFEALVRNKYQI